MVLLLILAILAAWVLVSIPTALFLGKAAGLGDKKFEAERKMQTN